MPKVADRTQQGFLNFLFLARLIKDPRGFASDPAFQAGAAHTPVFDGTVFYDGNSQGGILGGAVTAVSTEWTRAVLGVPAMNYSTLLQRSSDFTTYALILNPAYPDELDRIIGFPLLQMLWDRAEADGYAEHMTYNPYPGTPRHQVLMRRRVRRPPGGERGRGRRGAHDRRAHPPTRARAGSQPRRRAVLGHPGGADACRGPDRRW